MFISCALDCTAESGARYCTVEPSNVKAVTKVLTILAALTTKLRDASWPACESHVNDVADVHAAVKHAEEAMPAVRVVSAAKPRPETVMLSPALAAALAGLAKDTTGAGRVAQRQLNTQKWKAWFNNNAIESKDGRARADQGYTQRRARGCTHTGARHAQHGSPTARHTANSSATAAPR